MNVTQSLPNDTSEPSDSGMYARQLASLLGPAFAPETSTLIAADLLTLGDALKDVQDNALSQSILEAFVDTAEQLLSEIERSYGLTPGTALSDSDRQIRLTAKHRAARGGAPMSIMRAIAAYDPAAVMHELTAQDVTPPANFYFAVEVTNDTIDSAAKWREMLSLVRQMKPAHTRGSVAETIGFLTDDPDSLTDRDVLE